MSIAGSSGNGRETRWMPPSLTFVVFALPAALLFHAAANSHYRKLSLSAADFLFSYVAALREEVTKVGSNP